MHALCPTLHRGYNVRHSETYIMRTPDGLIWPRACGDAVPLPNGRIILLSGIGVSPAWGCAGVQEASCIACDEGPPHVQAA